MKKNWSLIVTAIVLLAFPLWARLGVLFTGDQFLRLEDVRVVNIDPEKRAPGQEEIDEMNLAVDSDWTLIQSLEKDGRLFLLFGETLFQDFYSYKYHLVKAQIVGEKVFSVTDERPFHMILYGIDDENILYGKHYASSEFVLTLYNQDKREHIDLKEFGRIETRPQVSYCDGITTYLMENRWEIFDSRGKHIDVDINCCEDTKIGYIAAGRGSIYFFAEEAPKRFIVVYNRYTKAMRYLQISDRVRTLTPMDGCVLIERGTPQANYSLAYCDTGHIERIREGQKFDSFRAVSPDLLCWVQGRLCEVYSVKEKQVIYSKELTAQQYEELTRHGTVFYLPPLHNLRRIHMEE